MAKHSVATLNTEVTGEKGASRLLASLVSHCLYWWWLGWAGGLGNERGRGALINFAKVFCYIIIKARGCIK